MDQGGAREEARFAQRTHRPAGRALGVKPGVPDLWMSVPSRPNPGLALKFKNATGTPPEAQDEWLGFIKDKAGWMVLVVRSAEEARATVRFYLDVELPTV